jgi:hypothetical protein
MIEVKEMLEEHFEQIVKKCEQNEDPALLLQEMLQKGATLFQDELYKRAPVDKDFATWETSMAKRCNTIVNESMKEMSIKRTSHKEEYGQLVAKMGDIKNFLQVQPRLMQIGKELQAYEK